MNTSSERIDILALLSRDTKQQWDNDYENSPLHKFDSRLDRIVWTNVNEYFDGLISLCKHKASLVVYEISALDFDPFQVVTAIRTLSPSLPVVIIYSESDIDSLQKMQDFGISFFVPKKSATRIILSQIALLLLTSNADNLSLQYRSFESRLLRSERFEVGNLKDRVRGILSKAGVGLTEKNLKSELEFGLYIPSKVETSWSCLEKLLGRALEEATKLSVSGSVLKTYVSFFRATGKYCDIEFRVTNQLGINFDPDGKWKERLSQGLNFTLKLEKHYSVELRHFFGPNHEYLGSFVIRARLVEVASQKSKQKKKKVLVAMRNMPEAVRLYHQIESYGFAIQVVTKEVDIYNHMTKESFDIFLIDDALPNLDLFKLRIAVSEAIGHQNERSTLLIISTSDPLAITKSPDFERVVSKPVEVLGLMEILRKHEHEF